MLINQERFGNHRSTLTNPRVMELSLIYTF